MLYQKFGWRKVAALVVLSSGILLVVVAQFGPSQTRSTSSVTTDVNREESPGPKPKRMVRHSMAELPQRPSKRVAPKLNTRAKTAFAQTLKSWMRQRDSAVSIALEPDDQTSRGHTIDPVDYTDEEIAFRRWALLNTPKPASSRDEDDELDDEDEYEHLEEGDDEANGDEGDGGQQDYARRSAELVEAGTGGDLTPNHAEQRSRGPGDPSAAEGENNEGWRGDDGQE